MSKVKSIIKNLDPASPRKNLFNILNKMCVLSEEQQERLTDFLNLVEKNNDMSNFDLAFLRENSIVFLLEVMKDEDLTILQDVDVILRYLNEDEINKWSKTSREFVEVPVYQIRKFDKHESEILNLFKLENLKFKHSLFELENFILGNSLQRKLNVFKLVLSCYLKKKDWRKEYVNQILQEQACGNFNFFLKNWINEIIVKQATLYLIEQNKDIELNETIKFYLEMYLFAESKQYIDNIKQEIRRELHWISNEISKENGLFNVQEKVVSIVNKYKIAYQEYVLNKSS